MLSAPECLRLIAEHRQTRSTRVTTVGALALRRVELELTEVGQVLVDRGIHGHLLGGGFRPFCATISSEEAAVASLVARLTHDVDVCAGVDVVTRGLDHGFDVVLTVGAKHADLDHDCLDFVFAANGSKLGREETPSVTAWSPVLDYLGAGAVAAVVPHDLSAHLPITLA